MGGGWKYRPTCNMSIFPSIFPTAGRKTTSPMMSPQDTQDFEFNAADGALYRVPCASLCWKSRDPRKSHVFPRFTSRQVGGSDGNDAIGFASRARETFE